MRNTFKHTINFLEKELETTKDNHRQLMVVLENHELYNSVPETAKKLFELNYKRMIEIENCLRELI